MPALGEPPSCKQRILVIDDEPDIRETLDMFLSSLGYEVSTAESGHTAVEQVQREAFDLVITDIRMPGMSGVDVMAALRRINPGLPVIVVSGYISEESGLRCSEAGAVGIIGKPFRLDDLLHVVQVALHEASE